MLWAPNCAGGNNRAGRRAVLGPGHGSFTSMSQDIAERLEGFAAAIRADISEPRS